MALDVPTAAEPGHEKTVAILVALATYWAERRQLQHCAATGAIHARPLWSTDVINFALTRPCQRLACGLLEQLRWLG
jgi:hypothetical protein